MSDIKYLILYKDGSTSTSTSATEIDLLTINTTGASTAYLKTFKDSLKNLLADNKSENIKKFLGELVKIAQTQVSLATATTATTSTTFNDVNPFVFAIDTTIGTKVQRTYLHFPNADTLAELKVNFYQYSVDTSLITINDVSPIFDSKLITNPFTIYDKLSKITS